MKKMMMWSLLTVVALAPLAPTALAADSESASLTHTQTNRTDIAVGFGANYGVTLPINPLVPTFPGGGGQGWELRVSGTPLKSSNQETIKGAKIRLANGKKQKLDLDSNPIEWIFSDTEMGSHHTTRDYPYLFDINVGTDAAAYGSQPVLTALSGTGNGTHQIYWTADQTTLSIPAYSAQAKKYSGKLVWTLSAAATS